MITPTQIYWITTLDKIVIASVSLAVISSIGALALIAMYLEGTIYDCDMAIENFSSLDLTPIAKSRMVNTVLEIMRYVFEHKAEGAAQ